MAGVQRPHLIQSRTIDGEDLRRPTIVDDARVVVQPVAVSELSQ